MINQNYETVQIAEMASIIKNHPKYTQGMPVYLLSCETGKGDHSYAQQLSEALKSPVVAPNEILWFWGNGKVAPYAIKTKSGKDKPDYDKPGKIRKFTPNE